MLSVSDVLDRLFDNNFGNSGSDSGGKMAHLPLQRKYSGPIALREEVRLDGFINCKFVLHIVPCGFCLPYSLSRIL